MGEEQKESGPEKRTRVLCGRCMAVLSLAVLVGVVQKLRRQRHEKQEQHDRHFPLFGH